MGSTKSLYGTRDLSERQKEVAGLVSEGLSNKEIAQKMGICTGAVKNYLQIIFNKLGVWSRSELTAWVLIHEDGYQRAKRTG